MKKSFFNRALCTFAALSALTIGQPAFAQSARAQADAEIHRISSIHKGPALVFAGCAFVATDEYYNTGNTNQALKVLVGCAAIGCAFTSSYENCLSVNTQLFLLSIVRS